MSERLQFNEKSKKYEGHLHGLKVVIPALFMNDQTILLAQQICESYPDKLRQLTKFCLANELFINVYDSLSEQQFIEKLGEPIINVYAHGGKLTYVQHQFDEEHIIDIEFEGVLEEFTEVVVDG